jgi:hypothetical protein
LSYDPENKIQFEELSPSLQERIIDLTTLYNSSHNGQVLKLDTINKKMFTDDNFFKCRVVSTLAELTQEKLTTSVDLSSVFNSWYAYAHGNNSALALLDTTNNTVSAEGQNLAVAPYTTFTSGKAWSYNRATGLISNVTAENVVSGFITPIQDYNNYTLKVKIDVGSDDDNAMIIVGYYKDTNGVEHTLSVVRGAGLYNGENDTLFTWGLIYDMGNSTQQMLINLTTTATKYDTSPNTHNYVYVTVTRLGSTITCTTSDYSSTGVNDTIDDNLTFSYTMPTSKENGMSDAMFTNLGQMLNYPSSVGLGARSLSCSFSIINQSGIWDTGYIYSLYDNQVYKYNAYSTAWDILGSLSSYLPSRVLLYNDTFNSLYFYYYEGVYQKITILPSTINANTVGGFPAVGDNNGTSRTWPYIPVINSSDGGMEIGRYIDFHYSSNDNSDFGSRIELEQDGSMVFLDHGGTGSINLDKIINVIGSFSSNNNSSSGNLIIGNTKIQYGVVSVTNAALANGINIWFSTSFSNNSYCAVILNAYTYFTHTAWAGNGDNGSSYTVFQAADYYLNTFATRYNDRLYIKFPSGGPSNSVNVIRYLLIGS